MGDSWRIGVDAGETTTVVRHGVFAVVRTPVFAAMIAVATGITPVAPNPVAVVSPVLLVATIELQVRVVEEPYLAATHGDACRDYTTVARFLPGIGRICSCGRDECRRYSACHGTGDRHHHKGRRRYLVPGCVGAAAYW
ncbi:isoprenylcysteine carboxylmethyltransferase family protein [Nocardia sp. BMG51109]|uniref:methyltransferase family protein n=1 Tax=Nocardia sp. BMG51109 TaxID=1056816 RepID=UPI00046600CA